MHTSLLVIHLTLKRKNLCLISVLLCGSRTMGVHCIFASKEALISCWLYTFSPHALGVTLRAWPGGSAWGCHPQWRWLLSVEFPPYQEVIFESTSADPVCAMLSQSGWIRTNLKQPAKVPNAFSKDSSRLSVSLVQPPVLPSSTSPRCKGSSLFILPLHCDCYILIIFYAWLVQYFLI